MILDFYHIMPRQDQLVGSVALVNGELKGPDQLIRIIEEFSNIIDPVRQFDQIAATINPRSTYWIVKQRIE